MKHISIGGLDVSRIGLGAMSMSGYYNIGAGSEVESIHTIHRALDWGVSHLDTAEIYGPAADQLALSGAQLERLNNLTPASGERHDEGNMATVDR
jgi:aryl-alcohol dehydrogenase-like predicted oxidoreductase